MTRAIALLFFLSGFVALLYEVLWIREFGYVLGASSPAIATVVAAYLSGLALGAWWAGRRELGRGGDGRRGGLAVYALLEVGIACTAPFVPTAMRFLDRVVLDMVWGPLDSIGWAGAARFAAAFALLVAPTALMGATLPVLCNALAHTVRRPGEVVGRLYGLNTLGGVLGCLLAGFVVLEHVGLVGSLAIASACNLALAGGAWFLHRKLHDAGGRLDEGASEGAESTGATAERDRPEAPSRAAALARPMILAGVLFTSGVSIASEMAWTRLVALAVGGTTYAFSLVLAVFLTGLGLGALLASAALRRLAWGPGALGLSQIVLGVFVLATVGHYDAWIEEIGRAVYDSGGRFGPRAGYSLMITMMIGFVPSVCFGLSFPLLSELWIRRRDQIGRGVGVVYVFSTAGGVVGSAATTFWLLPRFGLEATLAGLALASVVFGAGFSLMVPRLAIVRTLAGASALLVAVMFWNQREAWNPLQVYGGVFLYGEDALDSDRRALSIHDGSACSVVVFEEKARQRVDGQLQERFDVSLAVNGKVDASGASDMGTQLLLAWLPQLFHPDPQEVFVLGWGAGVTAGAAAHYGSESVVCAEIERGVIDASPYFSDVNFAAHDHDCIDIRVDDGRSVLRRSDARFDVITTEPSNPWMAGMSSLFTREFYELCRSRMSEDGVLCQWVQLYWSSAADYAAILQTLRTVFPHVSVFRSTFGDSLMLASVGELELDWEEVNRRLTARPRVGEQLVRHLDQVSDAPGAPIQFLASSLLVWGEEVLPRQGHGAPVITDDRPFLEFSAARNMSANSAPEIKQMLLRARTSQVYGQDGLKGLLSKPMQAQVFGNVGIQLLEAGFYARAAEAFDEAAGLYPGLQRLEFHRWKCAMLQGFPSAGAERLEAMVRTCGLRVLDDAEQQAFDAEQWGFALQLNTILQQAESPKPARVLRRGHELRALGRGREAQQAYQRAKLLGADPGEVQAGLDAPR